MIYSIQEEYESVISWLNILDQHLNNTSYLNKTVGYNQINKLLKLIDSIRFLVRRFLKTDDKNHKFKLGEAILTCVREIDEMFESMTKGIDEEKIKDIPLIVYELREQFESLLWVSEIDFTIYYKDSVSQK